MKATPDTILKLSLAAGLLLAGAGVGYYFGIFLPGEAIRETVNGAEQGKVRITDDSAARERERERLAEEQRREVTRQRYQSCVASADMAYRQRWATSCRAQHARQVAEYEDCADDLFSTREGCAAKFPVEPERGCALPAPIGSRLAGERDAAKAQCLGELQSQIPGGAQEVTPAPFGSDGV